MIVGHLLDTIAAFIVRGWRPDLDKDVSRGLDRVIAAGLAADPHTPLFGSVRVRHFGPRPLIEDASVTSWSTTMWNGRLGYRFAAKARLVLEMFNIFDANVSDIDYFYASRLPGEPAGGVGDVHRHPALPRSARLGLELSF